MWEVIRELVACGATLLLTTQYLEEADKLADDIVVIDHGRAIARGTADELKSQTGGERIELVVADSSDRVRGRAGAGDGGPGRVESDAGGRELTARSRRRRRPAPRARRLSAEAVRVLDIGLRRPTLDDVFLTLTGHAAADNDAGEEVQA